MRSLTVLATATLLLGVSGSLVYGDPKKAGGTPPGLAKKNGVPPGLEKKGGVPPGIAKKYGIGQSLPPGAYVPVEARYQNRLPYGSAAGQQWVRVGRDLYLLGTTTGVIADVIENWLD